MVLTGQFGCSLYLHDYESAELQHVVLAIVTVIVLADRILNVFVTNNNCYRYT